MCDVHMVYVMVTGVTCVMVTGVTSVCGNWWYRCDDGWCCRCVTVY